MPVFRKNAAATRSQRLSHPLGCVTAQREQVLRRSASGTPTENEPNAETDEENSEFETLGATSAGVKHT